MAVGHAAPERRAELLGGVLDRADAEPRHSRRLRLLAAACLDTAQMIDPEVSRRVEAAVEELLPPRGQNETRSLAFAGGRMLRLLPSSLDELSDASAAACVKTAALVGGPEAQRLLARWAPDPRGAVQRALAQVWRYFDPGEYATAVLRDAPLDDGQITVKLIGHVPHLHMLQHLRDARVVLIDAGTVDDLRFLRDAPPVTTILMVQARGPVDLAPLSSCPALERVDILGGDVSPGWEVLSALPALHWLAVDLPDGGRDLSFLTRCPSLTGVVLNGCTALSVSALVSASHLRKVYLRDAKHLRDLRPFIGLPNLERLGIDDAPLTDGLAAATPVLDRLKELDVWRVSTVTSLEAVAGTSLQEINLANCPITDLTPLATLQSLTRVWLRDFPAVDLAPLSTLPHLRELMLLDIDEPVDLSPLAGIHHRLQIELRNTPTVGAAGPLVKIRRR